MAEKVGEILAGKEKKGGIPELWEGKAAVRIAGILAGLMEKSG